MIAANWKAIITVLTLAAFLRMWGTFEEQKYTELSDEAIHVPNAISLGQYGTTSKLNWQHPPLSGLIIYGTISLCGNNPYGWRISNVFFGTASVLLIFLIGKLLYTDSRVSLVATCLLALDPFHIYLSRTTFVEVPVTFFFLLYLYLMLEYSENNLPVLPLAGLALGLTVATKAYFIVAIPLVAAYTFYRARQRGKPAAHLYADFILNLMFLPLAVYLLAYFKWFGRGYTLTEFIQMKLDAVWAMQQFRTAEFINLTFLEAGGHPWEWFLKPLIFGRRIFSDGVAGRFVLEINNPPFRMLTLPSMLLVAVYAWQRKSAREFLPVLLLGAVYFLFLVLQRPMFSYSALAVLPFAYLATARAAMLLAEWCGRETQISAFFICIIAAWGAYTFPLISGHTVPLSLYQPIISIATIMAAP